MTIVPIVMAVGFYCQMVHPSSGDAAVLADRRGSRVVCNADLKIAIKNWYRRWKMSELRERESETGHIKLKMPRDDLIKAMEDIIFAYNTKQQQNPTIRRCFDKTGFNLGKGFNDDLKEYTEWVDSLSSEAIYKSLIDANAAADLAGI